MSSAGTVLLQLQAAPIPSNMLQGAGRQHDRCSPTTQYVTGLDTSAGKAVLCPVAMIYSKALMTDLYGRCLPDSTGIYSGSVTVDI